MSIEKTLEIVNTVRENCTNATQERLPEAERNNIEAFRYAMLDGDNVAVANDFMRTLLNKCVKTTIISKMFRNPLKSLKKGKKPLGDTVEEIYTNFIKGGSYDNLGKELLSRNLPDTKTVYHRMNHQFTYKITVGRAEIEKAFASWEALENYIKDTIAKAYSSAELDEFINMKQIVKSAIDNKAMKMVGIEEPSNSEKAAKDFVKAVKKTSTYMTFPSTEFNGYLNAQSVDDKPIITLSSKDEQVLIIDASTDIDVSLDVLATTFNMSVAEFNDTKKIVIDAFPDPNIRAVLVDKEFFQVFDDLVTVADFRNPEGLYDNYYLHIWQTLAYSILVNAVAFTVANDVDNDGDLETYTVTSELPEGVTLSNGRVKNVGEGGSYATSVNGLQDGDTVTVTMGGSSVDVFSADTGKIAIDEVTGDIVITVTRA